jgi:polyphenol oxidase
METGPGIIKSKILESETGIVHGFSTMAGGEAPFYNNLSKHVGDDIEYVMANRARFFGELGLDISTAKFCHANQVHSANATVVNDAGLYPKTDALVTDKRGLNLVISVADCLPVMIYDKTKGVIANVHSGWRGTKQGIVTNTLRVMVEEFGCRGEDMIAFVGPGISCDKFEVGSEVAEMFEEKYVRMKAGKYFVDISMVVLDQLRNAGVLEANIERSGFCTYSSVGYLHSYRRDGDRSGRMFAVIGMKK